MKASPWIRPRKYIHFDWANKNPQTTIKQVTSPDNVTRWSFLPFLKFTIKTTKYTRKAGFKEKERNIMYACHADASLYSYYKLILDGKYEELLSFQEFSNNVTAFRKIDGKCNIHFARDAFESIKRYDQCYALAFDIEKFFDRLNHSILKTMWKQLLGEVTLPNDHYAIYKSLTKFSYVDKTALEDTLKREGITNRSGRLCTSKQFRNIVRKNNLINKNQTLHGIPQGSPLSGLLSNIYMFNFDKTLFSETKAKKAQYFRYCDDILIVCNTEDRSFFEQLVKTELDALKLKTNDKTNRHFFSRSNDTLRADKPLQYLGFMFDGERAYIRSSSISRHSKKIKKRIYMSVKSRDKKNEELLSQGKQPRQLFTKSLLRRNTHLGQRNFIRYGLRSKTIFHSKEIKKQIIRLELKFHHILKQHKQT